MINWFFSFIINRNAVKYTGCTKSTLYATFELRVVGQPNSEIVSATILQILSTMIRGLGPFERPQIFGAPSFSYGNMYFETHHATKTRLS